MSHYLRNINLFLRQKIHFFIYLYIDMQDNVIDDDKSLRFSFLPDYFITYF